MKIVLLTDVLYIFVCYNASGWENFKFVAAFVALSIQGVVRMRSIIFSYAACLSLQYFSTLSETARLKKNY